MTKHIIREWYDGPRARIIRALRWFDWVTFRDLCMALDLSIDCVPEYDNHSHMIRRLVREGIVECRRAPGLSWHFNEYRLAVRPPRVEGIEVFA